MNEYSKEKFLQKLRTLTDTQQRYSIYNNNNNNNNKKKKKKKKKKDFNHNIYNY